MVGDERKVPRAKVDAEVQGILVPDVADQEGSRRTREADEGPLEGLGARLRTRLAAAVPGHEGAVVGGLVGLILAVLVLVLGFWCTLAIAFFVVAGIAAGQAFDGNPRIIRALRAFINDRNK